MERFFLWFLPKVSIISIDTHIVEGIAFSMLWVEAYSLSVQFSCSVVSDSLWPHGLQHTRPPCFSLSPGACSNSCPSSQWCHPTISNLHHPLLLLPSRFPELGSFPMSRLFTSGGQSIGASASISVLPFLFSIEFQTKFPLISLTGLISLLSKGLSRVFSSTTVWKH